MQIIIFIFYGSKNDINPILLFDEGNKFTKKVMLSAAVSWSSVSKTFFVGRNNLKFNSTSYLEHSKTDLIPATKELYQ